MISPDYFIFDRSFCQGFLETSSFTGVSLDQNLSSNSSLKHILTGDNLNSIKFNKIAFKRSLNDVVSKNITMVLENLLKNYESSQLPTHGLGTYDYFLWS